MKKNYRNGRLTVLILAAVSTSGVMGMETKNLNQDLIKINNYLNEINEYVCKCDFYQADKKIMSIYNKLERVGIVELDKRICKFNLVKPQLYNQRLKEELILIHRIITDFDIARKDRVDKCKIISKLKLDAIKREEMVLRLLEEANILKIRDGKYKFLNIQQTNFTDINLKAKTDIRLWKFSPNTKTENWIENLKTNVRDYLNPKDYLEEKEITSKDENT